MKTTDRDAIRENLKTWLENPFWAAYYEEAPSDRCRAFVALEFYFSEYEDDEVLEAMDEAEKELDTDDLRHLMKYCGSNPRKGILARRIAEAGQGS